MGHLRILLPNQLVINSLTTRCRVTRHLQTMTTHEHGSPAELNQFSSVVSHYRQSQD